MWKNSNKENLTLKEQVKGSKRRGKESINPAVILPYILLLLLCSFLPSGHWCHSHTGCVREDVCVCVCIFVTGPEACPWVQRGATGHFNEQFSMERGGNGMGLELSNTASFGSCDAHTRWASLKACHCPSRCDQVYLSVLGFHLVIWRVCYSIIIPSVLCTIITHHYLWS